MSRDTLREVLHDVAEEQPPVHVREDTFRRGRRRHRRALVVRAAAAVAAVALGGTAVLTGIDGSPPAPAGDVVGPALPTRLYAVPERLAPHEVHGYAWNQALAAPGLAIGTTAAVYPVNMGAVVAVSAVDGSYHGLELPGFDEDSYFRFEDVVVAVSPDGDRLAYTWNPDVISDGTHDGYRPSGVRIVDVTSGKVTSVRIPGGYGVHAHGFSWSPDGRWLAYNLDVTTDPGGGTRGTRNFRMERLDTRTGERTPVTGLPRTDAGPVVSDRGEVVVVGNGPPASWLPGREPVVRHFEGGVGEWTAAWDPSGRQLAAGSWDRGWFSVGDPDGHGLVSATVPGAPSGSMVRALGWVDEQQVLLLHRSGDDDLRISRVSARSPRGGRATSLVHVDAGVSVKQLSVATGLGGVAPRDFPAPDWPTDRGRTLAWAALALAALAAVGIRVWVHRRRDH